MGVRVTLPSVLLSVLMGRGRVLMRVRTICLIAVLLIRGRIGIQARTGRMVVVVVGGMITMGMLMLSWRDTRRLGSVISFVHIVLRCT